MNVMTKTLAPGARSLPAELMIPRQYRTVDWPMQRLLTGGADRMQSGGGVTGIRGVGDCAYSADGVLCADGSSYSGELANFQPISGGYTPVVVQAGDPSFNWGALSNIITASSTSMAKILAASNPGTYYKDPQGNVIYSQPPGQGNLPGIYGSGGGYGGQGTFTSPLGSGTFGGISSSTIMMVAVVGLAFMFMSGRR